MSAGEIVPDYMTALVGYRAWNVTPEGDLTSLHQDTADIWPAKTKKIAVCTALKQRRRQLLGEGQTLGGYYYATTTMSLIPLYVEPVERIRMRRRALATYEREAAEHYPPEASCKCGIYAAKQADRHFSDHASEAMVWGEVYLWGKVQEYTEGYRAEFAYPKSLSTTRADLAARISERYGVPCGLGREEWTTWNSTAAQPAPFVMQSADVPAHQSALLRSIQWILSRGHGSA